MKQTTLQRYPAGSAEPAIVPPIVYDVLQSPGQPLDIGIRRFLEPRFGHDFSQVRVHADEKAAASADAVNAAAFTLGQDIVFGQGQYAPKTDRGRMLLAHELIHVLQQREHGRVRQGSALKIGPPDDHYEREASRLAGLVLAARPQVDGGAQGIATRSAQAGANKSSMRVQSSGGPYVARAVCINPDICASMNSPKTCLRSRCGYGKSGLCLWTGIEGGCCCLGAEKRPQEQRQEQEAQERERAPKMSREEAERKLRELFPKWIFLLISAVLLAALIACFASGVCEGVIILGAVAAGVALIIIGILRHAGVDVRGGPPTMA